MNPAVLVGQIRAEDLILHPRETALRLGCPVDTVDTADECLKKLKKAVLCRYAACRLPVAHPAEGVTDLGFGALSSFDLVKNLSDCREAFLLAVTLGAGVDRLLLRLSRLSPAQHFITDALASAMAEAACDMAEAAVKGSLSCRPRYSPGYGDLPLSVQEPLLAQLDASRRIGVTLGDALLMSPSKSITAIIGILS